MTHTKKIASMLMAVMLLCSLSVSALAIGEGQNIGVSPEPITRDTSIPTKLWDISSRYNFAGTSAAQNMYTNYYFTGRTSYRVHVANDSDYILRVRVKKRTWTFSDNNIPAHSTDSTYTVGGMDSDDKIYILFSGNHQDFSGYIEAA